MAARLLDAFATLFVGKPYLHRKSNQGDQLALELYEDLYDLGRSAKLRSSVNGGERGVGPRNRTVTLQRMRRGDGTFGQIIDPDRARRFPGYRVARGALATIDIAAEAKILNKAMIKQIDRVVNDLHKQVQEWQSVAPNTITVALVGINHAAYTVGYEGDRTHRTDGRTHKHPVDEAPVAEQRIIDRIVAPRVFDEVILLRYQATNEAPFRFAWVDQNRTLEAYRASLVRLSLKFDERF
ncbi:hypothetical protein [Elioraea sp.]|uniref:hypothetical protein n=1 Tax=Elioraea sp. TaxID=2185103 RepID=UPI003F7055DE